MKLEALLVDEYEPETLDEIVGQKKTIKKIKEYCMKNLPHLHLVGRPGTGKTTTVRVIIKTLNAEVKWLNGSEANGVNTFRSKKDGGTGEIDEFARHGSMFGKIKLIVIDECDGLSKEAMGLLKGKIEKYQNMVRFLLTANDNNLTDALKSRFKTFYFNPLTVEDILERLKYICDKQGLFIDPVDLETLAQKSRGDLRRAIGNLQSGDYDDEKPKDELETIFSFADGGGQSG